MTSRNDSYLELAERVLLLKRRPLSTREIMKEGYLHDLVPPHLHGRTQHKTLGARLSEDILLQRESSAFFRPRTGRFFLRRFIGDPSFPAEYRTPIVAKRRQRDIIKDYVAVISDAALSTLPLRDGRALSPTAFKRFVRTLRIEYRRKRDLDLNRDHLLYSFVVVVKGSCILTYRRGRYSEHRDTFVNKRTIGFAVPLYRSDYTLFDYEEHGAVEAGLTALAIDLDFEFSPEISRFEERAALKFCIVAHQGEPLASSLLTVVRADAPADFEPGTSRLAINDLVWWDMWQGANNIDDFDPWSRQIIGQHRNDLMGR